MLEYREENDELIIRFPQRLDTTACMGFQHEVNAKMAEWGKSVQFDLTGVTYIASLFLRICLSALQQAGPDRFRITNVAPLVMHVYKVAEFDQQINITEVDA